MCGICGIATPVGESPDRALLDRMSASLMHRGPDDEGAIIAGNVGLAMRRLSIIDLAGGHQPFANEDGSVILVFNGEIYNHAALRELLRRRGRRFVTESDTEVLLRAYEEWGADCVSHLNGMFAFAVLDRRQRTLFLARDRIGIKPLYYRVEGRRLTFASELRAILCDPRTPREVDLNSLSAYLAFEYVPSPRSAISGVRKLPPGHTLKWDLDGRGATLDRYWDVDLSPAEQPTVGSSVHMLSRQLRTALLEAVETELVSDVPLGVFLSGGVDSSAVAAMATRVSGSRLKTFSIGFTDPSFDESHYARLVARKLGTDHHELVLEPKMLQELVPFITSTIDEPLGDASIVPTYLLSQFTRRHVKVALSGDGGDELFAGYPTLQAHRVAAYYDRLPRSVRERLVPLIVRRMPVSHDNLSLDFRAKRFVEGSGLPVGERHIRWLGSFSIDEREQLLTAEVRHQLRDDVVTEIVDSHLRRQTLRDPINALLYLDMKLYLEGDILVKTDRASMLASLEVRVPLLNPHLVEHVVGLPRNLKLRGLRSKFLLRQALEGILPREVLRRRKKGFGMPVAKWLRGSLRDDLLQTLSRDTIESDGLFQYATVDRLVQEHLAGRKDHRKQLWTLFVFQRWYDSFIRPVPTATGPARG